MQCENKNSNPATEASDIIPDRFKGLFFEPPFLEGENKTLFWSLAAAVIDERKPETASDWVAVSDLVASLWDERCFRRGTHALLRRGMIDALRGVMLRQEKPSVRTFTLDCVPSEQEVKDWEAGRRARSYYGGNPTQSEERAVFLTDSATTEAELYAQAFECKSVTLQNFERMIAARERSRRRLRKEDARRRREKARETDGNRVGGRIGNGQ